VRVVLRKAQENIKKQADKEQREEKKWKKNYKVILLSMRDLIFKEKLVKKLTEKYVGLYKIEKVILKSIVKLKLLASMRIYLVVNISRVERYRELIKG